MFLVLGLVLPDWNLREKKKKKKKKDSSNQPTLPSNKKQIQKDFKCTRSTDKIG